MSFPFTVLPAITASLLAAVDAPASVAEAPASHLATTSTSHPVIVIAPSEANAVVAFWREAGPALWFAKDAVFDHRFRERFLATHEAAARGELASLATYPEGALALVILLDQFPRNAFRGTYRMYATDEAARRIAGAALAAGQDRAFEHALRKFFILPFSHSEDLAHQDRAVSLAAALGEPDLSHAMHHRDIIRRFGRFPHRNPILGRESTELERHYLDHGGFKG